MTKIRIQFSKELLLYRVMRRQFFFWWTPTLLFSDFSQANAYAEYLRKNESVEWVWVRAVDKPENVEILRR